MNAKAYLSQAYQIDRRINSKIEQVKSIRELALKANSVLSNMPKSGTHNFHQMEENVAKMIDLESEINEEIRVLLNLKQNILNAVKKINNPEYQTVLELRYLCFKSWEQIAMELCCGIDNVYKIHRKALNAFSFQQTLQ